MRNLNNEDEFSPSASLSNEEIDEILDAKKEDKDKGVYFHIKDYLKDWAKTYIIVSRRNIGKTTSMLKHLKWKSDNIMQTGYDPIVEKTYTKCTEFMLLRRSDEEVRELKASLRQSFVRLGWTIKGNIIYKTEGKKSSIVGRICSLSTAYNLSSNNLLFVGTILFDEFISRRNMKFDKKEYWRLMDFIITIERDKKDFEMFMMANRVTDNNPVFNAIGLYPDERECYEYKDKDLIVYNLNDKHFNIPNEKNSIGYKMSSFQEEVFDFAYKNKSAFSSDNFIINPALYSNYTPFKNFQLNGEEYGIYRFERGFIVREGLLSTKSIIALTTSDSIKFNNKLLCDDIESIAEFIYNKLISKKMFFDTYTGYEDFKEFCIKVRKDLRKA